MKIIDHNGVGRWSHQQIRERYAVYARELNVAVPLALPLQCHEEGDCRWISPVIEQIIEGIEQGDKACIEIGVECIEENQWFIFGRMIKADIAQALRKVSLSPEQIERLRKYIISMLVEEHIPRHYLHYARLLRQIGLGNWWPFIEEHCNRNNPFVMRYYIYFDKFARHSD